MLLDKVRATLFINIKKFKWPLTYKKKQFLIFSSKEKNLIMLLDKVRATLFINI